MSLADVPLDVDSSSAIPPVEERPHRDSWVARAKDFDDLCGYLYKRSRTRRWQKRYFVANDQYLTYYRRQSSELAGAGDSSKLLACVDLHTATTIDMGNGTPIKDPGEFYITLAGRIYVLKARDDVEAMLWVDGLRARRGVSEIDVDQSQPERQFINKRNTSVVDCCCAYR